MFKKMLTTRSLCISAVIAALYAALTLALPALSFSAIQCRVSEALTILPVLLPEAIPGLTVGCLISNIYGLSSGLTTIWDVVFGTLATLLAAIGTYALRQRCITLGKGEHPFRLPLLSALCPVISNGLIVGLVLALTFHLPFLLTALEVAVGEVIAVAIGVVLLPALQRIKLPGLNTADPILQKPKT